MAALFRRSLSLVLMPALFAVVIHPASAHPHVFVDGGVDFVFREGRTLEALNVTWIYDEFETLYLLSSYGLSLNREGELDEADRKELVRLRSDWPEDFDGSAHLTLDETEVELDWPTNLDLHLVDGRLQATFTRRLSNPITVDEQILELAFYESTYFYAFSITNHPKVLGDQGRCLASMVPFDLDAKLASLQSTLAKLSREETPQTENVGALFADRIALICE
ncbi:MAG: DUF1007 family protein [Pseudomonadota bacterium]